MEDTLSISSESLARKNHDGCDDERQEILDEIEKSVKAGRVPLESSVVSGRNGLALPLSVNIGALFLIALAAFLVPFIYNQGEKTLVSPRSQGSSAEAALFSALRHDSEQQLKVQEATIDSLQSQYTQVRDEQKRLKEDFDTKLKSRAMELEIEFRAALEVERARLIGSGLAEAATIGRMKELEARLQGEYTRKLDEYGTRLKLETADRDRALAETQARFDIELQKKTDPLMAELARVTALGGPLLASQRDLARRNEILRLELVSIKAEMKEITARADRLQASDTVRLAQRKSLSTIARAYASGAPVRAKAVSTAIQFELLQAKADTRAILAKEPIRSSKPGLAARLDKYFVDFENEYRSQGRKAALKEAIEILDSLAAGRDPLGLSVADPELKLYIERLQKIIM